MKTRYIGLCFAIIGLLLACSEEELVKNVQIDSSVQVKVQAHSGSDAGISTRLAYTDSETNGEGVIVKWSAGDAFYLKGTPDTDGLYAQGQMNIVERESYTATEDFYGVLSRALVDGEEVKAYYPSAVYDSEQHLFNVDLRKMTQNATDPMAHLSAVNYMVGAGTVSGETVTIDFNEGNKVAIVRFDFTIPARQTTADITELQIESENLHTIGTLSADNFEFTEDAFLEKHRQIIYLDGYTAGTSETKLNVYATILPTTLNQEMKLNVVLSNGDVYSSTVNFSTEASVVACNRYYIIKETKPLIELDYTWYTQLGPDAPNYEIETESQLFAFARIVNGTAPNIAKDDFSGQTVTLKENIALNINWTPIGTSYTESGDFSFKGTFNGGRHTISNVKLYLEVPSDKSYTNFYGGFFGMVKNASIKNLTLRGDVLLESREKASGSYYIGGLVGYAEQTTIENCRNEMNLATCQVSWLYMGGLIGYLENGVVKVCSNAGDVVAVSVSYPYMGGIIGDGDTDVVVSCFTEAVNITSTNTSSISYLGGLVGRLQNASTLVASYSLAPVDINSSDTTADKYYGGLAGSLGNEGSGKGTKVYGCYAVTKLVKSGKWWSGEGYMNVETEVNSETHMATLNEGIATWNATLSGITDPAYSCYSYKIGDTHLVLEKTTNIHSGSLEDMGNGGEIGY